MIHIKKWKLVVLALLLSLSVGFVTWQGSKIYMRYDNQFTSRDMIIYKNLVEKYGKLDMLYATLKGSYYEDLQDEVLMEKIYKGLFSAANDPYTSYMTKDEFENIKIKTTGKFQGIGVTLSIDKEGNIIVISPIKDTPAYRGGIKSGDIIKSVDGVEYKGNELETAVANMRGKVGTKVDLQYVRDGKVNEITLVRANITLESVFSDVLDDGEIGYIYISNFETKTGEDFKKELQDLESKGVKGVIIDLRNNGGGIVKSGIEVADELLGEGVLAYTENKDKEKSFMNTTVGKTKLPYVILINQGTASTSEILVSGVKDNNGGKIIGTKSFGKGIIQSVRELTGGDAIKITTAQYFSPKGKKIHGVGIEPDYKVEVTKEDKTDIQLEKAKEVIKTEINKK